MSILLCPCNCGYMSVCVYVTVCVNVTMFMSILLYPCNCVYRITGNFRGFLFSWFSWVSGQPRK